MAKKDKIFCIGVAKTGTTSLGRALRILGFNHKPYNLELSRRTYSSGDYEAVFREVEKFDSFDDGPWNRDEFYKDLDKRFPNSKFILTIREMQSWIKSHEKHFSSKGLRKIPKELWMDNYDDAKKAELIQWHKERTEGVLDYFKDRPDQLLIIDICGGEEWEKLCSFLNLPIPNESFPVANVTLNKYKSFNPRVVFNKILKKLNFR